MAGILKLLLLLLIVFVLLGYFGLNKLFRSISDTIGDISQNSARANTGTTRKGSGGGATESAEGNNRAKSKIFPESEGEYVDYKEVE